MIYSGDLTDLGARRFVAQDACCPWCGPYAPRMEGIIIRSRVTMTQPEVKASIHNQESITGPQARLKCATCRLDLLLTIQPESS